MRFALAAAILITSLGVAHANGVMSSFPAGGVEYHDVDWIHIAREDLYISLDRVTVHYRFQSERPQAETITMGFPLPAVPSDPDALDYLGGNGIGTFDARNYADFVVSVNGQSVEPELHEFAWLDGVDVSGTLQKLGVSLLPGPKEMVRLANDADLQARLVEHGLAIDWSHQSEAVFSPLWDYQVIFEWSQAFQPGETEVDIAYRPMVGYSADVGSRYEDGPEAEFYCVDPALKRTLESRRGEGRYYEVLDVGYITTTANHWAGPIGEFNLTVDKLRSDDSDPADTLVAFCPVDSKKVSPTQFVWSATDYVPENDINVVFFAYYN